MIGWPHTTRPTEPPKPPPLPGETAPAPTGWSRRRIKGTAANAFAGFLLGIVGPAVWGVLGFLCTMAGANLLGLGRPDLLAAFPIAIVLGYATVYGAAHGTCSKSPVAPMGVALGISLGAFAAVVPHSASILRGTAPGQELVYIAAFLAVAGAQAVAALKGGRRGLARRFGDPQHGVGVLCATCAYDLEHTPEGWPCPECGGMLRYPTKSPTEG